MGTTLTFMVTALGAPPTAYLVFHLELLSIPPPNDTCRGLPDPSAGATYTSRPEKPRG